MYDNTCKYLAEQFPEDIASWLIGERISLTQMNPTELNVAPIHADSMMLLRNRNLILHIEFQTVADEEIPFRMIDYRIRSYRRFPKIPMRQIVIYLTPTTSELVYQTRFGTDNTQHQFEVIRLWEQPAEIFLESPGLYPFASLGQTTEPEAILRSVAAKIEAVPERSLQANLTASTYILAGLVLNRDRIQQILRGDIMRESVTYQDILAEGEAKGKAEGEARGEARGLERGLQQEKAFVIRLLTRKLDNLTPQLQTQVNSLKIDTVESLGEALLDFTSIADLESWLSQNGWVRVIIYRTNTTLKPSLRVHCIRGQY